MYQHTHKHKKLKYDEQGQVIVPPMDNLLTVSDFLQDLFEIVVSTHDKALLTIYNKTANTFNSKSNKIIFLNFQNPLQMAKAKQAAAATEQAAAATTKTAAPRKGAAQPAPVAEAPIEAVEKPLSQKEIVCNEAAEGLSVAEIVEKHGFIKTNVSWYFSKHKLHLLPIQVQRKAEAVAAKAVAAAPVVETPAPATAATKKASAQK